LPYGDDAAQYYRNLRSFLEKQGTLIGSLVMLIAAHALSVNCALVTNNEKKFSRVQGLQIENWIS
jgi:tRNA(fMet)-specific endonuclease VapC